MEFMVTFTLDSGYQTDIPDDPLIVFDLGFDENSTNDLSTRLNRLDDIEDQENRERAARELLLILAIHQINLYCRMCMEKRGEIYPWLEQARQAKSLEEMEAHFKPILDSVRRQFPNLDSKAA